MIKRGIMDKEHKTGRLNNFFTNNGRYDETHGSYRRVYLLNAILLVMPVVCIFFAIVDIIIFDIFMVALINAVSAILVFFLIIRRPPRSALVPCTALYRSRTRATPISAPGGPACWTGRWSAAGTRPATWPLRWCSG